MPLLPVALRTLNSGLVVAEPLTAAEISALAQGNAEAVSGITQRTKELLESDSAEKLHRRFAEVTGAEVRRVELTLDPPKRQPAWQSPAVLAFDVVFWQEGVKPMLHHARVPGTEVHVMGNDAAVVERRLQDHLRLLMLRKDVGLRTLATAASMGPTTLSEVTVEPKFKTPRQRAEELAGKKEEPSVLAQIANDLTAKGVTQEPAFELESSLRLLADALGGAEPLSVLIIGAPGVGKSALVRQFARQRGELGFGSTTLWSTAAARLIAGQSGFGMWQERCRDMIREAARTKAILHLGNLWELMEVGKFVGNTQSIAAFLRPAIARGELLCIAECTPEQFAIIERTEPHLASVFYPLHLAEPAPDITRRIIGAVHDALAAKATDSSAALDWLHRLHQRYATYSANPGRPLRFLRRLMQDRLAGEPIAIAEVTTAFTRDTGLPALLLDDALKLDATTTHDWFAQRVLGQDQAVAAIVSVLATIKARLNRPRQPLASLLFIGPTGTGKTELAKSLAEFLFGNTNRLARFDLNEFGDAFSVQRLIGGPAAGSTEGLLTARVREHPFSVLLFDEFEKADPAFFDLLLQVLGDGRLTDASGRVADFCNTVIIMTSNLGARDFQRGSIGFPGGTKHGDGGESQHFASAVRDFLRPEIYNRLGGIVPFHALSRELAAKVLQRHLGLLRERDGLKLHEVTLRLDAKVEAWLLDHGFDERYGARPLKRVLERSLMTPVAEALAEMDAKQRQVCTANVAIHADGTRLVITTQARKKKDEAAQELTSRYLLSGETQQLRRTCDRLRKCAAINAMENELPLLLQTERRVKLKPKPTAADLLALERLNSIRAIIGNVDDCCSIAAQAETRVLHELHRNLPMDEAAERALIREAYDTLRLLKRRLFLIANPAHDDVLIMLVADNARWLHRMVGVYAHIAQEMKAKVVALDYIMPPPAGSKLAQATRLEAKKLEPLLDDPPKGHVGLIMRVQGELMRPCFMPELGMHRYKGDTDGRCYVEAFAGDQWRDFKPPAEAHRASFFQDKSLPERRAFDQHAARVTDTLQGPGNFSSKGVDAAMQNLILAQLERQITEVGA